MRRKAPPLYRSCFDLQLLKTRTDWNWKLSLFLVSILCQMRGRVDGSQSQLRFVCKIALGCVPKMQCAILVYGCLWRKYHLCQQSGTSESRWDNDTNQNCLYNDSQSNKNSRTLDARRSMRYQRPEPTPRLRPTPYVSRKKGLKPKQTPFPRITTCGGFMKHKQFLWSKCENPTDNQLTPQIICTCLLWGGGLKGLGKPLIAVSGLQFWCLRIDLFPSNLEVGCAIFSSPTLWFVKPFAEGPSYPRNKHNLHSSLGR